MISIEQAIDIVNTEIRKSLQDPDYKVYSYDTYEWGWIMVWMPPHKPNKVLYGSSPYLVHKNGYIREFNKVAWDHKATYKDTIKYFLEDAEKKLK
jgi:hypothetical protein